MLRILESKRYFGEIELLTGISRPLGVKSLEFSRILKIQRTPFLKIIKTNQQEFEEYCMLKDQIVLQHEVQKELQESLRRKCLICAGWHLEDLCDKIQLLPDRK